MNRLKKKCAIAAAGLHLLLLLILFVGPAFFSPDKADDLVVLEFIPLITTDANVAGGGSPNAKPPQSNPPPQPPKQESATPPQPRPQTPEKQNPIEPPKPPKAEAAVESKPDPKSHKIQLSDKVVVRQRDTQKAKTPDSTRSEADAKARAEAERKKLVAEVKRNIREGLSGSTSVEMPGPGGGGPAYANYKQVLASIYYQAWQEPDDSSAEAATAVAAVVVARDGSVISAHITKSSGDRAVDRSVEATLQRVRFIAPFPEGAKDEQRSFTVNFNAKAKQKLG